MRRAVTAAIALAVLLLAGCAGSHTPGEQLMTSRVTIAVAAPTTHPVPTINVRTTHPLSYYAAQYTRIIKPANAALAQLVRVAHRPGVTVAQLQTAATATAKADQKTTAALLRVDWPNPKIRADVEALVRAQGPILGDLADITTGVAALNRDSGPANAASNIVRADLGLPPTS